MYQRFFVTAIGTDSGKTLVSAMLVEALQADYWKPVQSGEPADTDTVRNLIRNKTSHFYPEHYRLKTPASPHAAARIDGITIDMAKIVLPRTDRPLIVEGAGGLMVPLNDDDLMIDLIRRLGLPVILVSNNYLGSINHTLLSHAMLQVRDIPVRGIVFNGPSSYETESIILKRTGYKCLLRIPQLPDPNPATLAPYINEIKKVLINA